MSESMYSQMGVDAGKDGVKKVFKGIIDNEYPGAWVNMITDPMDEKRVITMHCDGDGSKSIQRLLHHYELNEPIIFKGMVDDALAMNTADIAASGFVFYPILISDILDINADANEKKLIMSMIAERFAELKEMYADWGITLKMLGGETADLRDQVRSMVFNVAAMSWADKDRIITGNVQPGDMIYGFRSDGRSKFENEDNSGTMANGQTLERTVIMSTSYNEEYPMLYGRNKYRGSVHLSIDEDGERISRLILSPTRQWPIVIKILMEELIKRDALHLLHGISVNTGGGAVKVKNLGKGGICFLKTMPEPPEIFQVTQKMSGENWKNMYQTFNCGIGLDIIGSEDSNGNFQAAIKAGEERTGVSSLLLGTCFGQDGPNTVKLETNYGSFDY